MAAGLGFKDFVTGEVLTAADVDGYLMQNIWVFASAAARDAAVTAPSEGNFAYLKDTNVTTYYTGSAWANLDTTGMTNPMTTTGDTIYSSSGSTPARLGIGSTGNVLTVAGGVPTWAAPAGGGGMTLLNSGGTTLSGSSTSITTLSTSYNDLYIVVEGFRPSSDGSDLYIQLNEDSNANRHFWGQPAFTDRTNTAFDNTGIRCFPATDNTATDSVGIIYIPNYADTNSWKFVLCYAISNNNTTTTNFNWQSTQGAYNQTTAISSLKFFPGTANMSAGTVYVYGVK